MASGNIPCDRCSAMRKFVGILLGAFVVVTAVYADQPRPSTSAERARALEVIQKLEADPMNPSLEKARDWINPWVFTASDVHVVLCTSIIRPLLDEQNSDPRKALMLQNLLSMAAFEMK